MFDALQMRPDLVILGGARTAMAEYSGTPGFGKFKDITAIDLAAHAAKAALQRAGVSAEMFDETFIGNAAQSSKESRHSVRYWRWKRPRSATIISMYVSSSTSPISVTACTAGSSAASFAGDVFSARRETRCPKNFARAV